MDCLRATPDYETEHKTVVQKYEDQKKISCVTHTEKNLAYTQCEAETVDLCLFMFVPLLLENGCTDLYQTWHAYSLRPARENRRVKTPEIVHTALQPRRQPSSYSPP
jgi:hypothetical protein